MNIYGLATLRDVIKAIRIREYDWGRGKPDTFWKLFYEARERAGVTPEQVVVEGRAEFFADLPEGIEWHHADLTDTDFPYLFVINSGGWNERIGENATVPVVYDLIMNGSAANLVSVKRAILARAEHPEETFMPEKPLTMIADDLRGPYTVLEGNHSILAAYHLWRTTKELPDIGVLVGVMPPGHQYPRARFWGDKSAPRNEAHSIKAKTDADLAAIPIPDFVRKALE